jgi:4-hydroxybenzoate polyprenyltransferase
VSPNARTSGALDGIARALRFIRFSHTIFALPFALGSVLVAAHGWPQWQTVVLILVAMVCARTAAMCFNRVVDWEIDRRNPRTNERHTLMSRIAAIALLMVSAAGFIVAAWRINPLCFALAPVALFIVFFYSLTKRFTSFSHFFLGLALSVSPVGAWLAVRGHFELPPLILALAVLLWVAGFDMIYATLDEAFDRASGLHSWAVAHGVHGAQHWAMRLHAATVAALAWFGASTHSGVAYWVGLLIVAGALVHEHRVAARRDVAAVNQAFFLVNAVVGVVFAASVFADQVLFRSG